MEQSDHISEETRTVSPLVAGIGNRNPYQAPAAYFENFPVQVLLRIAIEEKAGTDPLLNINKTPVYQVPDQYFDGLADAILQRIKARENNPREELEQLSPLLGQMEKKNPFISPEGYFNDFSDNIMAGVKAVAFVNEELENLPPTIAGLKAKPLYSVPENYFDRTPAAFLQKAKHEADKATVIPFGKKIMRYAAAAVIAGIVVLSGYLYLDRQGIQGGDALAKSPALDSASLAKIPDQEMENFLNNNTASVADTATIMTAADDDINDNDVKDLLASIPDEELQHYADQHSEAPITN